LRVAQLVSIFIATGNVFLKNAFLKMTIGIFGYFHATGSAFSHSLFLLPTFVKEETTNRNNPWLYNTLFAATSQQCFSLTPN